MIIANRSVFGVLDKGPVSKSVKRRSKQTTKRYKDAKGKARFTGTRALKRSQSLWFYHMKGKVFVFLGRILQQEFPSLLVFHFHHLEHGNVRFFWGPIPIHDDKLGAWQNPFGWFLFNIWNFESGDVLVFASSLSWNLPFWDMEALKWKSSYSILFWVDGGNWHPITIKFPLLSFPKKKHFEVFCFGTSKGISSSICCKDSGSPSSAEKKAIAYISGRLLALHDIYFDGFVLKGL